MLGYAQVSKPKKNCEIYVCLNKAVWRYDHYQMLTPDYYCDEHKPKAVRI